MSANSVSSSLAIRPASSFGPCSSMALRSISSSITDGATVSYKRLILSYVQGTTERNLAGIKKSKQQRFLI